MSIPSQSQSSPLIHFTNTVRRDREPIDIMISSPPSMINNDSQPEFPAFLICPQSTPRTSPKLLPQLTSDLFDNDQTNENVFIRTKNNKKQRLTTFNYSSLTNVTPLNDLNNQIKSQILYEISDDDDDHEEDKEKENRYILRPPPLMVLSQSIQAKHPEQLIDTKLTDRFSSIKDLPNVPANYSFVFYNFTSTQIEEVKRLTRRMGDCFTSEIIDITTTHVILPNDNPHMTITLEFILALIYGCCIVTFDWLKSSCRHGEWLNTKRFEPKKFFYFNSSLNIYRKSRQQKKSIELFSHCGLIYLTSIVEQRQLLLKLITLLGGNITVNRDRAQILVGQSSKKLQIIIYPHVNEQWAIDSIKSGKCLSTDNYLVETNNDL